ncbi:MAG: Ig-like domain-containing protein, partial [Cloacibacillus sp.]
MEVLKSESGVHKSNKREDMAHAGAGKPSSIWLIAVLVGFLSFASFLMLRSQAVDTDTIYVSSRAELEEIAANVNAESDDYASKTVILSCDLDLSGDQWTPIGGGGGSYNDCGKPFQGTFDGGGHTIYGLSIDLPAQYNVGLFGIISADAVIRNLNVSGDVKGGDTVGIIVGKSAGGRVEGCAATGLVNAAKFTAGGVVGYSDAGVIINSSAANCNISVLQSKAGGIAGALESGASLANCVVQSCDISQTGNKTSGSEAGGVAGYVRGSTVINSVADCLVTSNGSKGIAGGIVGRTQGRSSILNCYSSGTLVAAYLGGIAGAGGSEEVTTIENCISSAVLSGDTTVKGGIIGNSYSSASLKNCGWPTETANKAYGNETPGTLENVDPLSLAQVDNCVTSFTGVSPFISADRNTEGASQIFRTWPGSRQDAVSSMDYTVTSNDTVVTSNDTNGFFAGFTLPGAYTVSASGSFVSFVLTQKNVTFSGSTVSDDVVPPLAVVMNITSDDVSPQSAEIKTAAGDTPATVSLDYWSAASCDTVQLSFDHYPSFTVISGDPVWSVSGDAISIDNNLLVSAMGTGGAQIASASVTLSLTGLNGKIVSKDMSFIVRQRVTGISCDLGEPRSMDKSAGQTLKLNAAVLPAYACDAEITWSSSSADIASVDQSGDVTLYKAGAVDIAAKTRDGDFTKTQRLDIYITPTSVDISPGALSLKRGATETLTAEVLPADASVSNDVTWSVVGASGVVSIAATGGSCVVSALKAGTSTVKAVTGNGKYKEIAVTVTNVEGEAKVTAATKTDDDNSGVITIAPNTAEDVAIYDAFVGLNANGFLPANITPDEIKAVHASSADIVTSEDLFTKEAITEAVAKYWNVGSASQDKIYIVNVQNTVASKQHEGETLFAKFWRLLVSFFTAVEKHDNDYLPIQAVFSITSQDIAALPKDIRDGLTADKFLNEISLFAVVRSGDVLARSLCDVTSGDTAKYIAVDKLPDGGYTITTRLLLFNMEGKVTQGAGAAFVQAVNVTSGDKTRDDNYYLVQDGAKNDTYDLCLAFAAKTSRMAKLNVVVSGDKTDAQWVVSGDIIKEQFSGSGSREIAEGRYSVAFADYAGYTKAVSGSLDAAISAFDLWEIEAVYKAVKAAGISLDKSSLVIAEGKNAALTATLSPDNALAAGIEWTSSAPSVATVDALGVVAARKAGSAVITAKTADGTALTAQCSITVYGDAKDAPGYMERIRPDIVSLQLPQGTPAGVVSGAAEYIPIDKAGELTAASALLPEHITAGAGGVVAAHPSIVSKAVDFVLSEDKSIS